MIDVEVMAGSIHKRTRKAFESGKKIIIHKGGTGSGKTYDIMIFLLFYIANNHPNWIITVVSESKPHLDIGAIRYAKQSINNSELSSIVTYNETKGYFTFPNGSIIEFFSADRIDKALGARRNLLYGNEINSLKESVWDELARRSDYVIGDFNPTAEFWLEKWLSYYDDTIVITSNYKDNPYLQETERARIEKRASMDSNFRRVHVDCEYGNFEGLVFTSITQVDEIPEGLNRFYGLDFGYSNDPASVIECAIQGDNLYLNELIYQTGLSNSELSARMKYKGIQLGRSEVFADSAEPKSIDDLYLMGWNIHPTIKGADSIMWGLSLMNEYKIHVTKSSLNLIKEFRNYTFAKDKNGKELNRPIDSWNHAIDAARYAVSMKQRQRLQYNETTYIPENMRL